MAELVECMTARFDEERNSDARKLLTFQNTDLEDEVAPSHACGLMGKVGAGLALALVVVVLIFQGRSLQLPRVQVEPSQKEALLPDRMRRQMLDMMDKVTAKSAAKKEKDEKDEDEKEEGKEFKHEHEGKNHSKEDKCYTARPGEPCYEAVLWHKWVGVVENPSWYKEISRQSNRHDIQHWLFKTGQGSCSRPCSGSYPVPEAPKGKHPQIYCFSVSRGGAEMDTMFLQRQTGSGIFSCDGYDVYSDQKIDIDGYQTQVIPSTASGVSVDGTAANSQVFLKTWMAILTSNRWWHFDFIAKVDPDAILYADRLRGHLQWHVGQDVFFLNCAKYVPATMYGALEVFSKAALGAYLSQHKRCEKSLPFWSWGEDRYMAGCLQMLGVQTQPDYLNFLHDERCWGVDCGNKAAVAFHSFKQVNTWYRCYESSK